MPITAEQMSRLSPGERSMLMMLERSGNQSNAQPLPPMNLLGDAASYPPGTNVGGDGSGGGDGGQPGSYVIPPRASPTTSVAMPSVTNNGGRTSAQPSPSRGATRLPTPPIPPPQGTAPNAASDSATMPPAVAPAPPTSSGMPMMSPDGIPILDGSNDPTGMGGGGAAAAVGAGGLGALILRMLMGGGSPTPSVPPVVPPTTPTPSPTAPRPPSGPGFDPEYPTGPRPKPPSGPGFSAEYGPLPGARGTAPTGAGFSPEYGSRTPPAAPSGAGFEAEYGSRVEPAKAAIDKAVPADEPAPKRAKTRARARIPKVRV